MRVDPRSVRTYPLPMASEATAPDLGVAFERRGALARIHLNRPKALNALTLGMANAMLAKLAEWEADDTVSTIAITGEGRAFCAGGDIRAIYERGRAGEPFDEFFATEYALDIALHRYPKPVVALIDGIAMGGGVGVGYHVGHVIVGENARFAMPECSIGFFPDVGATHLLNRVGGAGYYLGLTGTRVGPGDQVMLGLADAFVPSDRWDELLEALANGDAADRVVGSYRAEPPTSEEGWSEVVEQATGADLHDLVSSRGPWKEATAKSDPLAIRIAIRQLTEGKGRSFEDCMRMEARIAYRMLRGESFYEGIRAAVIDKDQAPQWRYARVEDVPSELVAEYFAPVPDGPLAGLGG